MQQAIIEDVTLEEQFELKDMRKAQRMLRSEAARARRRETKHVREMKILNEWAKARREKSKQK